MKRSQNLIPSGIVAFLAGCMAVATNAQANCRSFNDLRIDNSTDPEVLDSVCEVGTLAVFVDDQEQLVLPNLKSAGLINIDSNGLRAIAFPALKHARDLYISGSGMEVSEFPVLETVDGRFVVNGQNVKFLNLPEMKLAGRVLFNNCPDLEFVFADKLLAVNSFKHSGTPALNEHTINMLANISVLSEEEWQERQLSAMKMREFRVQLMMDSTQRHQIRPTGHKTQFREYNNTAYYDWYPYEFDRYWWVIGAFGFQWYYWIR